MTPRQLAVLDFLEANPQAKVHRSGCVIGTPNDLDLYVTKDELDDLYVTGALVRMPSSAWYMQPVRVDWPTAAILLFIVGAIAVTCIYG